MAIDEMANNTPDDNESNAEDPQAQALEPVEANLAADDDEKTQFKDDTFEEAPRGIVAFLAIMLLFYIVYWFLIWFEIIIGRGA